MLFNIFNSRMQKVDWVDAESEKDALKHACRKWPGAAVERVLSAGERRQKEYEDEADFLAAIHRR